MQVAYMYMMYTVYKLLSKANLPVQHLLFVLLPCLPEGQLPLGVSEDKNNKWMAHCQRLSVVNLCTFMYMYMYCTLYKILDTQVCTLIYTYMYDTMQPCAYTIVICLHKSLNYECVSNYQNLSELYMASMFLFVSHVVVFYISEMNFRTFNLIMCTYTVYMYMQLFYSIFVLVIK